MALNKFMHPRNVYKIPPDFSKLFKEYKDFSAVAKMDVTGKVSIDFKDPQALRVLTKCLLKADFGLDIIIPEDRLVPTLPLRLNYVLWIEDLMTSIGNIGTVSGLDIGTGACAIYPLLAAVKNKWHMVGTEKDEASLQKARENVEKNNLQNIITFATNLHEELSIITVRKNETSSLIQHIVEDDAIKFDFCMCNPPFYSNVQDLWDSRSPARPPPKNGFTGSPQELITEGGELEFCRNLIKESIEYKDKILVFTTMIGHKYNMKELVLDLKGQGIKYTTTEFCQGRVTRWGLAWTFQEYDLYSLVPPRDKPRKKNIPINFVLPELPNRCHNVENATDKIKTILSSLNIDYKLVTIRRNETIINFTAVKNTWSNQRRKRRLKKFEEDISKKIKLEEHKQESVIKEINCDKEVSSSFSIKDDNDMNKEASNSTILSVDNTNDSQNKIVTDAPAVQGIIKLSNKSDSIVLDLEYVDGFAGKEGIHQILQYIKNNWK